MIAPSKPAMTSSTAASTEKGTIISTFKSSITYAKTKLNILRTQRATVFTPIIAVGSPTKKHEPLEHAVHRLPVSDEGPRPPALGCVKTESQAATATVLPPAPPDPSLSTCDFEIGGSLGRGKFGRVYLARHLKTNYICALKIISKAQCSSTSEEKLIRRELEIHQNLAHKNILKLLSWFHDVKSIYLVLEFAPGGSLYSKLQKQPKGRFDEKTTAQFIVQMAEALRYMHAKNILHRDIKPENILLGLHSEIKLADFGYSVHSESGLRSTVCGTLDYISPEIAVMMLKPGKSQDYYTKAIDQWSLGVLTYELLVGKPPFETKSSVATQRKIAKFKGGTLKFPGHVSREAEELIRELLNLDAEKRTSLDDVLVHPWIMKYVESATKICGPD